MLYNVEGKEGNWTGDFEPVIGQRVNIIFNSLGKGTIVNRKVVNGFIAVEVTLDKNPTWRKQNLIRLNLPEYTPALAFGPEVSLI